VETNEQTAACLLAQRDYARRQRSCEILGQADPRRAANRSRSERCRLNSRRDRDCISLSISSDVWRWRIFVYYINAYNVRELIYSSVS